MLSIFTGTPGSGKSVHATKLALDYLKKGRHVLCNYELDTEKIPNPNLYEYVPNKNLNPKDLIMRAIEYQNGRIVEDSVILIIEEAAAVFNARSWMQRDRSDWITFFTQSRKLGYMVVVVAQRDSMIDKQIRDVFEYEFRHYKIANYGMTGWLFGLLFNGKLHLSKQIYHPTGDTLGSKFFIVKRDVYEVYDTFAIVSDVGTSNQKKSLTVNVK